MTKTKEYLQHNQKAWDKQALANQQWSMPVSEELVAKAKQGDWDLFVLPTPIDKTWLGDVTGKKILCLASAGGQQAPILAAAGAKVTVMDLSVEQLNKDKQVADRDNLHLTIVQGDMTNLEMFQDNSFDIIVHPISNLYVSDVTLVWNECYRVLNNGGRLISSFYNPVVFIHDKDSKYGAEGVIKPKYKIPYADLRDLSSKEVEEKQNRDEAFVFGHSLQDLIGGQLKAGFLIKEYEEAFQPNPRFVVDHYLPTFIATVAIKLQ
ncbi:class I SAM-dependent methyltransferase [Myroides marinus]|uniref:Methyltransferase domain-containing protein n=1 Tax=Myroides marinus TaxID=703342 RepID=A0A1H6U3T4_9FLAO|nr:class I SAM-dependent methyltransferase [Myroides marinus]KUF42397.1 methyltransferase [Myroides marinus]MDM1361386.1 class I SAM-dependent methyltransferase [Myroides marinus]MDM1502792.1 class I SAM-dependent methyltransferase [Myroides marinus]SEI87018.1 Methyltransferase domain-containing protein [Myroides marinus]